MANFENDLFIGVLKNDTDKASDYILNGVTSDNSGVLTKDEYKNNEKVKELFTKDGKFQTQLFDKAYDKAKNLKSNIDTIKDYSDFSDQVEYYSNDIFRPMGSPIKEPSYEISKVQNPLKQKMSIENLFEASEGKFTQKEVAQQGKVFDWDTQEFTDESIVGDNALVNFASSVLSKPLVYARYTEDGTHEDVDGNKVKHQKGEWKTDNNGDYYCETVGNREAYNLDFVQTGDILTKDDSWMNNLDVWDSDGKDKSVFKVAAKTVLEIAPYFIPVVNEFWIGAQTTYGLAEVMPTIVKMADSLLIGDSADDQSVYKGLNRAESWFKQFEGGTSEYGADNFFGAEQLGNMIVSTVGQLYQMKTLSKIGTKFAPNVDKQIQARYAKGLANVDMKNFDKDIFLKSIQETDPVIKELFKTQSKLAQKFSLGYMALTSTTDVYADAKNAGYSNRAAAFAGFATMASQYALMSNNRMGDWMLEKTTGMNAEKNASLARKAIKGLYGDFEGAATLLKVDKVAAKKKFGSLLGKAYSNFKNLFTAASYGTEKYWKNMVVEGVEEMTEEALSDAVKGVMDITTSLGLTKGKFNQLSETFSGKGFARYMQAGVGGAIGGGLFQLIETKVEPFVTGNALPDDTKFDIASEVAKGNTQELLDAVDKFIGNSNFGENYEVEDEATGVKTSSSEFIKGNIKEYIKTLDSILNIEDLQDDPDAILSKALQNSVIIPQFKKSGLDKFILSDYNKKIKTYVDDKLNYDNLLKSKPEGTNIAKEELEKKVNKAKLKASASLKEAKSILNGDGYEDYLKMSLIYLNGSIRKNVSETDIYGFSDLVIGKSFSKMNKTEQKLAKSKYKNFQKNIDKPAYMKDLVKIYDGLQKKLSPVLKEYGDGKYLDIHKQSFNQLLRNRAKLSDEDLESIKRISNNSDDKSLLNNIYDALSKKDNDDSYVISDDSLYNNFINELNNKVNKALNLNLKQVDISKSITKEYLNKKFDGKTGFQILREDFTNINSRSLNNINFTNYNLFNSIGAKLITDLHSTLLDSNLGESKNKLELLKSKTSAFKKSFGITLNQNDFQKFKEFVRISLNHDLLKDGKSIVIPKSSYLNKLDLKSMNSNVSKEHANVLLDLIKSNDYPGVESVRDLIEQIVNEPEDKNTKYIGDLIATIVRKTRPDIAAKIKELTTILSTMSRETEEEDMAAFEIEDQIDEIYESISDEIQPIEIVASLDALTDEEIDDTLIHFISTNSISTWLRKKNDVVKGMGEVLYNTVLTHELIKYEQSEIVNDANYDVEKSLDDNFSNHINETLTNKFKQSESEIQDFNKEIDTDLSLVQDTNKDVLLNSIAAIMSKMSINNIGIITESYVTDNTKNLVDGIIYDDLSKSKNKKISSGITGLLNLLFSKDNVMNSSIFSLDSKATMSGSLKTYLYDKAMFMYKDGNSVTDIKKFIFDIISKINNIGYSLNKDDTMRFINGEAIITLSEKTDETEIENIKSKLNIDPTVNGIIPDKFILDINNINNQKSNRAIDGLENIINKKMSTIENDSFEKIRKVKKSIANPLYVMLRKFTKQLSDDKEILSIFDVLEHEEKNIKNLDDVNDYLKQGFQREQILNAIKTLKMFKGVIFGAETSIDNKYATSDTDKSEVFSYNQQVNNYNKRNGKKDSRYKTVGSDVISYMNEDVDMLVNKLEFLIQLSDSNSLSKVQENNKSELKYYVDLKKKLSELINSYPEISNILDADSIELLSSIDSEQSDLDKYRSKVLQLQQNIFNSFTILIKEKGKKDAIKILTGWYDKKEVDAEEGFSPDLNKPVSNKNVLMFLVTSAFTDTADYIKKYTKIYDEKKSDTKIPFFTQQFSVKLGYSVAIDIINKTNLYREFMGDENTSLNMFFLDAVSGAGKTSVVASQILKMLTNSLKSKDKLNVVISAPQDKQVDNLKKSLTSALTKLEVGKTDIKSKNKKGLFEHILEDGKYDELLNDEKKYNDPKNKEPYTFFSKTENLIKFRFKKDSLNDVFNEKNIRNLDVIFIDEVTHYSIIELKILDILSQKYNIPIITLGDTFQIGKSLKIGNTRRAFGVNFATVLNPPRINLSMRVTNIHKKDNIDSFQSAIRMYKSIKKEYKNIITDPNIDSDFNSYITSAGIKLNYFDDGDIQGDKLVDEFDEEDFKSIKKNLKKGDKVGILSDLDENNELKNKSLKALLDKVGFTKDQVEYYSPDPNNAKHVQGSEEKYFIIDEISTSGSDIDQVKLIYTYVTRSLNGTILKIDPTLREILNISSKEYSTTSEFRTPKGEKIDEMVTNLKSSYSTFLENTPESNIMLDLSHEKEEEEEEDDDSEVSDDGDDVNDDNNDDDENPPFDFEFELPKPEKPITYLQDLKFGEPEIIIDDEIEPIEVTHDDGTIEVIDPTTITEPVEIVHENAENEIIEPAVIKPIETTTPSRYAKEFNLRTYSYDNNLHYNPAIPNSEQNDDNFGIRNLIGKEDLASKHLDMYSQYRHLLLMGNTDAANSIFSSFDSSDKNYVINIVEYNEDTDGSKHNDANKVNGDSQITEYNGKQYQIYLSQRVYNIYDKELYTDIPILLLPKYEPKAQSVVFKQIYQNIFKDYKAEQLHSDFKLLFDKIKDQPVTAIKVPNNITNLISEYNKNNAEKETFTFGGIKGIFNFRQPIILNNIMTERGGKYLKLSNLLSNGSHLRASGVIGNTEEDVTKLLKKFKDYIEPDFYKKIDENKSMVFGQYFGIVSYDAESNHDPKFEKFMLFKSTYELNELLQFRRNSILGTKGEVKLSSFGWMDKPAQKFLSYSYFNQLYKILGGKKYKDKLGFTSGLDENGELTSESKNIILKKYLQAIKNHIDNDTSKKKKDDDVKFLDSIIDYINANRTEDLSDITYKEFKDNIAVDTSTGEKKELYINHLGETIVNLFSNYTKKNVKEKFVFNFPPFLNMFEDSGLHAFAIRQRKYVDKNGKRQTKTEMVEEKVNQPYINYLLNPDINLDKTASFYYKGYDKGGKNKYIKNLDFYRNQGNINYSQNLYNEIPDGFLLTANVEIKKESESLDNGANTKKQFGYYMIGNTTKAQELFKTNYNLISPDVYLPFHILRHAINADVENFEDDAEITEIETVDVPIDEEETELEYNERMRKEYEDNVTELSEYETYLQESIYNDSLEERRLEDEAAEISRELALAKERDDIKQAELNKLAKEKEAKEKAAEAERKAKAAEKAKKLEEARLAKEKREAAEKAAKEAQEAIDKAKAEAEAKRKAAEEAERRRLELENSNNDKPTPKLSKDEITEVIDEISSRIPDIKEISEILKDENIDINEFISNTLNGEYEDGVYDSIEDIYDEFNLEDDMPLILIYQNLNTLEMKVINKILDGKISQKVINKLDPETQSELIDHLTLLNTKC